ncbi:hypothetical protein Q9R33_18950 [Microbacterium sp. PRC9]|nr:hypothetical protein [Microbacterium sp. PRC9]MDT0144575.1 hypothetical protein [Microbacterium sp. PRC9]
MGPGDAPLRNDPSIVCHGLVDDVVMGVGERVVDGDNHHLHPLDSRGGSGRRIVVEEVGRDQKVDRFDVAGVEGCEQAIGYIAG